MTDLERERIAAIWAMTPADHLDAAIRLYANDVHPVSPDVTIELLFALVKKALGEPRFENEGAGA